MTTLLVNGVAKGVPRIRSTDTLKSPVWENEGFELVTYTPHCSGETKWVLPTPCVTHLGVNTDRGSSGHLSMYGDIVFNHGSLITIHFPMQTCVTKGWWQVRKYWVLQRKRGMKRGNLVNGCWPGLIIAAHKSCVSATPQPLERFLFGYLYKLLILLLHGTQSGYLHAGAKPESSVQADINRYSN